MDKIIDTVTQSLDKLKRKKITGKKKISKVTAPVVEPEINTPKKRAPRKITQKKDR